MKKWEHFVLDLVNITFPIIASFILGVMLTAKLFNPEITFILSDYAIIVLCLWVIFMFQKEKWNDLRKNQSLGGSDE